VLLSSTLELAEGLLEFAQEEGLARLAACLGSAKEVLAGRLAALQQQPSGGGTSAGACGSGVASASAGGCLGQQPGVSAPTAHQEGKQHHQDNSQQGPVGAKISTEVTPDPQPSTSTSCPLPPLSLSKADSCSSGSGLDTPNSLQESLRASLTGFRPREVELQYAMWASVCCTRLMNYWRPAILGWLGYCMVQSIMEGRSHVVSHLVVHLLLAAPNVVGMLLAWKKQYRWVGGCLCQVTGCCVAGFLIALCRLWKSGASTGCSFAPAKSLQLFG
jgi:hypothetical protein